MAVRRCLVAFVVSLGLLYEAAVQAFPDGVALAVDAGGLISLEARINGAGPFRLLLDTGTSSSAVSRKLMRTLQLAAVATAELVTPSGSRARDVVRLDVLSVGTASKRGLLATVLEDRDLGALGHGIDGIIGQNFLAEQHYTIDYRRGRLSWRTEADHEAPAGVTLELRQKDGRWLVGLPQGGEDRVLWLVADSGAEALVLFDRGSAPMLKTRPARCCAGVTTVNGSASARLAVVPELKVGSEVLRNRRAVILDHQGAYAPGGDGLLPLRMFASVSFHPCRQFLRVTF